jgi:hypothetical protein
MTKKVLISPAFEEGHFNGLVDEGKFLRQSSLYKQILPRTPSRQIRSLPTHQVGLRNPWLKICEICVHSFLSLTSTKHYVRNYKKNMQNEPNFRKSQVNVSDLLIRGYEQMDTWSIRKNEPKTNPNEPKTNPILANKTPKRTQFKPKQTQFQRETMLLPMLITGRPGLFGYCTEINKTSCILSVNLVNIGKYT